MYNKKNALSNKGAAKLSEVKCGAAKLPEKYSARKNNCSSHGNRKGSCKQLYTTTKNAPPSDNENVIFVAPNISSAKLLHAIRLGDIVSPCPIDGGQL